MLKSERITDHESQTPKKRNGQTNPTLRKLNAPKENGRVLPQSGDGWSKRSAISCQRRAVSGTPARVPALAGPPQVDQRHAAPASSHQRDIGR